VTFGSDIKYANGTTFVLQPGIYLVQLSVPPVLMTFPPNVGGLAAIQVNVLVNANTFASVLGTAFTIPTPLNSEALVPVNDNELLPISAANTVVGFNVQFAGTTSAVLGGCRIIFTQLK
jgi:hypothetical protein